MTVHLRFFATLRKHFGEGERLLEIPEPRLARDIFFDLFDSRETAERFIRHTRFAVNCEYVSPETLVKSGDELAFIPPVSGG